MLHHDYSTLKVERTGFSLQLTLNRPELRNAMNLVMVEELISLFAAIKDSREIRAVILRGAGGHFCAGGDIKDMAAARAAPASADHDPLFAFNRRFGEMISQINAAPQVVIAVLEGAVLGGGFGLACVSDLAIARRDAQFGLPESGLGIPPAQIAAFVVERIGLTQTRRLALLGLRFDGEQACALGIVHEVYEDSAGVEQAVDTALKQIRRCAPGANARTKEIMLAVGKQDLNALLDSAAEAFSAAVQSEEGREGSTAFMEKRLPAWAQNNEEQR